METSLGTVSVVMTAQAASCAPAALGESAETAAGTPVS